MSTSPISLPKKLKIAQLFGERNTYRLIATKSSFKNLMTEDYNMFKRKMLKLY